MLAGTAVAVLMLFLFQLIIDETVGPNWIVLLKLLMLLFVGICWVGFFRESLPRSREWLRRVFANESVRRPPAHPDGPMTPLASSSIEAFRLDAIQKEFYRQAIVRGRTHLYEPTVAAGVIRMCRELGWQIRALNAFEVSDITTKRVEEQSIDLSGRPGENWDEAEQFIEGKKSLGLLYEVSYQRR